MNFFSAVMMTIMFVCMLCNMSVFAAATAQPDMEVFHRLDASHFSQYMRSLLSEEEMDALEDHIDASEEDSNYGSSFLELGMQVGNDQCKEIMTSWIGKCVFSV